MSEAKFDAKQAAEWLCGYIGLDRSHPPQQLVASLQSAYDAGLSSGAPPDGHVLTSDGTVRKVLGTLPMTADGFVIGDGCSVFVEDVNWKAMGRPQFYEYSVGNLRTRRPFYSTREAAEAARKERGA